MALNSRQLRFIAAYLQGLREGTPCATTAYLSAGYRASRESAHASASRLLASEPVQQLVRPAAQAIEAARLQQVRGLEAMRDQIMEQYGSAPVHTE
ncbi:hypothetical protein FTUN_0603 [Frigoriglobus tundricola]|uniref:Terminase small subunit n=1 Tax=Frigoriglobus tundricola TaxID=2774151 RepID=A0A6M5YIF5_9BACT|nr:hypothetical protein FTUN_0603 [Frigoriglobus tundricola]